MGIRPRWLSLATRGGCPVAPQTTPPHSHASLCSRLCILTPPHARHPLGDTCARHCVQAAAYPPSLKSYVHRAFESCAGQAGATDVVKTRMESVLKVIINESVAAGDLQTRNWNTFPLPV